MKARLHTLTAIASLAIFLIGCCGEALAQTATATRAVQDPDLQAIQDNVLTIKGMRFPRVPPNKSAKSNASCCTIGDSRSQDVMTIHQETQGVYPQGKVTYEATTPYSPPSTCWVISAYNLSTMSERNASYSLTAVPGGYSFVTSNQYQQTYQEVKNIVLNMNILNKYKLNIIANLQQFTNNYASYAQSLGVSHGSVLFYLKLESAGKFNGRSWYDGIVRDTETCCPPEITDAVALKATLITWVNNTVNALPNKGQGTVTPVNPKDIKNLQRQPAAKGLVTGSNPEPSSSPTPR